MTPATSLQSTIVIAADVLYVGNTQTLWALNPRDGSRLRTFPAGPGSGGVAVSDGALYATDYTATGLVHYDVRKSSPSARPAVRSLRPTLHA